MVLEFLKNCGERTECQLQALFDSSIDDTVDQTLIETIRYASLGGGKRIRPTLVYASADILDLDYPTVDPLVCAIELIHCYSLIHDDLPAMDDDDLRRGKPSCHKAFGEAMAILAGDAMQALAFEQLSKAPLIQDANKNLLCQLLAKSVGINGMASGQAMDIAANNLDGKNEPPNLEQISRLKTGALMAACITLPLHCRDEVPELVYQSLSHYAKDIGLCFQLRDDILDHHSDDGSDNVSYVQVHGKDKSQKTLEEVTARCLDSLSPLGDKAQLLSALTQYIACRES